MSLKKGGGLFNKNNEKEKYVLNQVNNPDLSIKLQSYQLFPAYYLKHLKPSQKGLLINHLMGTGKTFTGLNFLNEFKDKKAYVICPGYLINTWNNEKIKLKIDLDIEYISINNIKDFIINNNVDYKNSVVVIDEGHNLINIIRNELDTDLMHKLYSNFKKFYKILFMTGTAFYQDQYDIIYIINLVSGEDILPYNKQLFEDEYFKISPTKAGFYGWFNKILGNPILYAPFVIAHFGLALEGLLKQGNAVYADYDIQNAQWASDYIKGNPNNYTALESIDPYSGFRHYKVINNRTGDQEMWYSLEMSNLDEYKAVINERDNSIGVKYMRKFLGIFGMKLPTIFDDWAMPVVLSISTLVLILIIFMITSIIGRFDLNKIKSLDGKKLGNKIKEYISIYDHNKKEGFIKKMKIKYCHSDEDSYILDKFCENYLNDLDKSDFPNRELFVKNIQYNSAQMEIFMRACYNRLTPLDVYNLGIAKDKKTAKLFNSLNNEQFLNYGRVIGNLNLLIDNLEVDPPKFKEILQISNNKQTVIYSNFYEKGILLFAHYLKQENKKFNIILPNQSHIEQQQILNRFKDKKIQYLLLHPEFTEGLSIIGANQLHILEPLQNYSKFEQLQYRVIRKNSHTHLELKERKVQIYLWVSKVYPLFDHFLVKYKSWKKYSPQVIFWKKLTAFDENLTPDSVLLKLQNQNQIIYNEFNQTIKDYSIETCFKNNKKFTCDLPIEFTKVTKYEQNTNKSGGYLFSPSKDLIKKTFEQINNIKYNFELKPYQLFPAYYLQNIQSSQKGLLINHLMGTGKTFTGLHFLNNFKDKKLYVLCPEYLINTWKNENFKLGTNLNIQFYTYDNFDNFLEIESFNDSVIILDEGHNFIYKLRNNYNEDKIDKIYNKMYEFDKILFLTGTPFYQDEFDIVYIINLVAGKNVLPFNKKLFEDKYFSTSTSKKGVLGWLNPIIGNKFLTSTFLILHFSLYISGLIFWMTNYSGVNMSEKFIAYNQDQYLPDAKSLGLSQSEFNSITNELGKEAIHEHLNNNPTVSYYKSFLSLFGIKVSESDLYKDRKTSFYPEIAVGVAPVLLVVVLGLISKLFNRFDLNKIKQLDSHKLGKDINIYISAYDNNNSNTGLFKNLKKKICHSDANNYLVNSFCNSYLNKLDLSDFPEHRLIIKKVTYNSSQMDMFIRLCYERLLIKDIKLLGITKDEHSKYIDKLSNEDFLNYGRIIGNLTLTSLDIKNNKDIIYISPKFIEILKISENKQTVIYSNFYEKGILLFAKFLKDNNLSFKILIPNLDNNVQNNILDSFKNHKFQYLLLHPEFTEGISIIGANQLHILEPLNNYAKFEQLQYRVIRKNSHTHLPVKERKVDIYQWIATTSSLFPLIIKKLKGWKEYSPQVIYWERLNKYDEDLSPDSIVFKNNNNIYELYMDFKDMLNDYSIENCSLKNKKFKCDINVSLKDILKAMP
jgi:superfamily II DNA or RNA helicase